jgi:hypothetical protein
VREVSQARERERKEDKTHRSFLPATRVSTHLPFKLRVHGLRRWDRDVPMGKGWDHQCSQVSIVDVERDWLDYTAVLRAFFDRERRDKMAPLITRASHEVVKVRRIQNQAHYGLMEAQGKLMVQKRGKSMEDLTVYAWHGSEKTRPDEIAGGKGFMMQYGSEQGFYGMGS